MSAMQQLVAAMDAGKEWLDILIPGVYRKFDNVEGARDAREKEV
jgi:hypothetical protein